MANVCEFRMTIRGNAEGLDKVETVFRDADPSLCFCRFWTDCVSIVRRDRGHLEVCGGLPWTDAYLWDPSMTLGGHVGDVAEDGRTVTSIPRLCGLYGLCANGEGYEPGCQLDNSWTAFPDGSFEYYDLWEDEDDEEEEEEDEPDFYESEDEE